MNKVYILIEQYTFEKSIDTRVTVYADKDKAIESMKAIVEREKTDTWIATEKNVVIRNEEMFFDAYVDGYATDFETLIMVQEKEIL